VADKIIRIFSDLHYGERSSRVRSLKQLAPLLDGVDTLILNGDTLDTRHGPYPEHTAAVVAEVKEFLGRATPKIIPLSGNHDPDFSALHALELANGRVLVTHGDTLFEDIVPWGRDAPDIRRQIAAGLAALTPAERDSFAAQAAIYRRVSAALPQRHQAERNLFKYVVSFIRDTFWPPTRFLHVLRAWREAPERAAALARQHWPEARFIILGHLHRPGIWQSRDGRVVINTGSFCPPFGACLVDLTPGRLVVRRIAARGGAFYPGRQVAEFALAEA